MNYLFYNSAPTPYLSGTWSGDTSICNEDFSSINGMIEDMKETHIGLREMNWKIYGRGFMGFTKHRIMLKELYDLGYFSSEISKDSIGMYYNYKP